MTRSNRKRKSPDIRFKGFTEDWEQRKLGDLYFETRTHGNDSLPILSVSIHSGVSDDELNRDTLGKDIRRSEDKSLYKRVEPGDLVFNMMRAWQGAIGIVKNPGMVSPAYITARSNKDVVPMFIDFAVKQPSVIYQIDSNSYGVTSFRKRLYWKPFQRIILNLPPTNEQKRISQLFASISVTIALHQRQLDQLHALKQE
ncbi:restriction endonuclease subunit S, partial [Schleiferilactobacillus perolens]|uniref:restriction endonuclease subunit S n=1 Tax=Schleiferilactobacillus perolens TaxID=100468 RepID=UPI0039EBDFA1